ncbi:centromere protein S isoform X2 [Notamacropus eugenii]|uniref:centromere protein S isoform X2 n=1 Tax=Notamacropus eugenii TaxID=9315 RepID=UPI003B674645
MEPGRREEEEEEEEEQGEEEKEDQPQLALIQNLKASLHYTVGSMCQEAADAKGVRFTKSTIAAISEVTFRQCEHFARDLELFARHAKRSTINMEDVKLLARRSSSLLNYITEKSEEISRVNQEQKDKKKKKAEGGSKKSSKQAVTKMDIDD